MLNGKIAKADEKEETNPVQEGYVIVVGSNGITGSYNGEQIVKQYLCLLEKQGEYQVVTPKTEEARVYYFNEDGVASLYQKTGTVTIHYKDASAKYYVKNGELYTGWYTKSENKYYYISGTLATGWKTIAKKKYYFDNTKDNKGVLLTNTIVGSKKSGYYYVDSTGVQVTAKEMQQAAAFVKAHTKSSMSQSAKLKACFNYLWKNYKYKRFYETPKASKMAGYAKYMFTNKQGNCFRYASSFACIAKVLGYDVRVAVGKISSARGGMTPHGWTEVKVNGKWYMCDANMQRNHPGISSYMKTNKTYAYRHSCSARYKLTIKNGKVTWK
jgi:hypothetical protein